MTVSILKSKIHRATVTQVDLDYIGSISIDETLMQACGLFEFEKVDVLNITNGNRLQTYVIKDKKNSGTIGINGAAAHLINKNDYNWTKMPRNSSSLGIINDVYTSNSLCNSRNIYSSR